MILPDWAVLLTAFFVRFGGLTLKPPHADEGVNGYLVNRLLQDGFYSYNPLNFHGPLLFYLFGLSQKVFGFGIFSFRLVTVIFSFFTVWIVLRGRDVLGRYAVFFSAAALALSPGMVFFGRSAIHEAPFVFFQVTAFIGFLKMREKGGRNGLLLLVGGLTGCVLLKETFVITCFAFFLAWTVTVIFEWMKASPEAPGPGADAASRPASPVDKKYLAMAVFSAVIVWLVFYSGFFHNWRGAADFFYAFSPWLKTGTAGAGHEKPFSYWLALMARYEWVGLAGFFAAIAGVLGHDRRLRFLSVFALANWAVYSLVPYKTPWCVTSILWPFVIVAGVWFEYALARMSGRRIPVIASSVFAGLLVAGPFVAGGYRLNYIDYTDPSEPYVYVQTKNDIKILQAIIRKKTEKAAAFRSNMKVQICLGSCWPLPWIFSPYPNLRFADVKGPFDPGADIILTEVSRNGAELGGRYLRRKMELRDGRQPIYAYLKKETFQGMELPGFEEITER